MTVAKDDEKRPIIIIKKIKRVEGGHHGGAWKVAYADFVTAMMAFFLLLWLLNVTTDEQKAMISSYFAPADPRISESMSGSGGVMGGTTVSPDGAQTDTQAPPVAQQAEPAEGIGKEDGEDSNKKQTAEEELEAEMAKMDEKTFKETEEKIRQAIEETPELKDLSANLLIDMTPEGLRIQVVDQEGRPMFALGSATPLPEAIKLFKLIAGVVHDLPNHLSIRGHTDSKPYGKDAKYTNWELSADRSNAARRIMLDGGLDIARIENVQGKADREHLITTEPESARNRRISIILMKLSLTPGVKQEMAAKKGITLKPKPEKPQPKKREEGVIYFP